MILENKLLIFLVEDNPAYRLVIKVVLQKMGFSVMQFENGREAADMLHHRKPALIISDIDMPQMNGFSFLKFVREHYLKDQIPFIFISSTASEKKKEEAQKLSSFRMLDKPISPSELEIAINEILSVEIKETVE